MKITVNYYRTHIDITDDIDLYKLEKAVTSLVFSSTSIENKVRFKSLWTYGKENLNINTLDIFETWRYKI